jgi:S1-C subfamily serine protease
MRVVLAAALAIATSFAPVPVSVVSESPIAVMSAVFTNAETGASARRNFCSAFAVKTKKFGLKWVTAQHCVDGLPENAELHIGKYPASVIKSLVAVDIAILDGVQAPGYEIATESPEVGDRLIQIGHPWGWKQSLRREGFLSAEFDVRENGTPMALFQIPAAPGDSGSPVFNSKMQVVGVLQVVFCGGLWEGFCPMSGGSTLADLQFAISTLK